MFYWNYWFKSDYHFFFWKTISHYHFSIGPSLQTGTFLNFELETGNMLLIIHIHSELFDSDSKKFIWARPTQELDHKQDLFLEKQPWRLPQVLPLMHEPFWEPWSWGHWWDSRWWGLAWRSEQPRALLF